MSNRNAGGGGPGGTAALCCVKLASTPDTKQVCIALSFVLRSPHNHTIHCWNAVSVISKVVHAESCVQLLFTRV